jgi:hypothetical protein
MLEALGCKNVDKNICWNILVHNIFKTQSIFFINSSFCSLNICLKIGIKIIEIDYGSEKLWAIA